jgi:MYXO-CTERM domain-containing protein
MGCASAGFTCQNCTLQVFQWMSNHGLNNPGGCFYHHCAAVNIVDSADMGATQPADLASPAMASPDLPPVPTGCGCHVGGAPIAGATSTVAMFALFGLGLALRRRRRSS